MFPFFSPFLESHRALMWILFSSGWIPAFADVFCHPPFFFPLVGKLHAPPPSFSFSIHFGFLPIPFLNTVCHSVRSYERYHFFFRAFLFFLSFFFSLIRTPSWRALFFFFWLNLEASFFFNVFAILRRTEVLLGTWPFFFPRGEVFLPVSSFPLFFPPLFFSFQT